MAMLANASAVMQPSMPMIPTALPTPVIRPPSATPSATASGPAHNAAQIAALIEGNKISAVERETLTRFLSGDRSSGGDVPVRQVVLNEETKQNPTGGSYVEQIVFEVNFTTGQWKKLRRKLRQEPAVPAAPQGLQDVAAAAAMASAAQATTEPAAPPANEDAPPK